MLPGENRCPETTLRVLVDLVVYAIVLPPQTDPPGTTPGRFSAVLWQSQTGRVWVLITSPNLERSHGAWVPLFVRLRPGLPWNSRDRLLGVHPSKSVQSLFKIAGLCKQMDERVVDEMDVKMASAWVPGVSHPALGSAGEPTPLTVGRPMLIPPASRILC